MNTSLFIAVFAVLTTTYLILGSFVSKKVTSVQDYFLAGKNLGFFSVTFTLIATQLGGGMLLGTSAEAYKVGIYGILYTLGMSFGFLILGLGLAAKLQKLNVATTAQIFEVKYGSIALKKIASLLSIATMCGILIGQIIASKNLMLGLGITNEAVFLLCWAFIVVYTIMGGLAAVVITDIAQVLVIILVFSFIFAKAVYLNPSSLITIFKNPLNASFSWDLQSISKLMPILVMPMLFSLIEQDLAQRFFASRTAKIAATSAAAAGTFILAFSCLPIYFGVQANMLGLPVPNGGSPLIPFLEVYAGQFLMVLAVCGIIAAITSTADSLLCAISSNIAQDFKYKFGISNELTRSKIITFLVGIGAVTISYLISPNIINILVESYAISVSCLLVPTLLSLYRKKNNPASAWGAMIFGLASFIIFKFYPVPFHQIITLLASLSGYLVGQNFKKR